MKTLEYMAEFRTFQVIARSIGKQVINPVFKIDKYLANA